MADVDLCGNCGVWKLENSQSRMGECRRFAPRPISHMNRSDYRYAIWPLTHEVDWCDMHVLNSPDRKR